MSPLPNVTGLPVTNLPFNVLITKSVRFAFPPRLPDRLPRCQIPLGMNSPSLFPSAPLNDFTLPSEVLFLSLNPLMGFPLMTFIDFPWSFVLQLSILDYTFFAR